MSPQSRPTNPALEQMRNTPFASVAELLGTNEGRARVQTAWDLINAQTANSTAKRVYAGVSQDAGRYYEVYRGDTFDGYALFIVDLHAKEADANKMRLVRGEEQVRIRDHDARIAFVDPDSCSDQSAELHLRPAPSGTSSFFVQTGNHSKYAGEVLPMAYMQQLAGFDVHDLRISMLDDGQPTEGGLRDNTPRRPPGRDLDDIAV